MAVDYAAAWRLFFACAACGAAFGLFCDALRFLRMLIPHGFIMTALEDVFFCLVCMSFLILCFFNFSHGSPRLYAFLVCFTVFAVWQMTLGRLTRRICDRTKAFFAPKIKKIAAKIKFALAFLRRRGYTVVIARRFRRKAGRGFGLLKGVR